MNMYETHKRRLLFYMEFQKAERNTVTRFTSGHVPSIINSSLTRRTSALNYWTKMYHLLQLFCSFVVYDKKI